MPTPHETANPSAKTAGDSAAHATAPVQSADGSPAAARNRPHAPECLCKRVIALLAPAQAPFPELWERLEAEFGGIDFKGELIPFDTTEYYRKEFGSGLRRGFISFRGLQSPERLPDLKHAAARLEAGLARDGKRVYNLDIGYLDPDKLVLASFKRGPCKLYLRDGVYADLLLRYSKGGFDPFPWAFADFQDGRYGKSLLVIREKLKSELRQVRGPGPGEPE
jgi:Domain of unknown function (DUF4416)